MIGLIANLVPNGFRILAASWLIFVMNVVFVYGFCKQFLFFCGILVVHGFYIFNTCYSIKIRYKISGNFISMFKNVNMKFLNVGHLFSNYHIGKCTVALDKVICWAINTYQWVFIRLLWLLYISKKIFLLALLPHLL